LGGSESQEVDVETKEQLINEYKEWTVKYVEADQRLKALEEEYLGGHATKELLVDFLKAEEDVKTALARRGEIREKPFELR